MNYGVSDKLIQDDGTVKVELKKKNFLSKAESKNILGSAHQSVVQVKDVSGKDRYFMAYHRFYTPLNIFTSEDGLGKHRETCVDEITFDENGEMVITPTLEGVAAVEVQPQIADDGKGKIEVDVQAVVPGSGKTLTVQLPASFADSIKNSSTTEASIQVNIPKSVPADQVAAITLAKEILQAAKDAGKNLTVSVSGSNPYTWGFRAGDLANAQIAGLNLALRVDSEKDAEVKNLLKADQDGMALSFAQQGQIPAGKVTLGAKAGWKAGDKVTLSYYNSQTKALEKVQEYTVGEDGKITVDIVKGGRYVLWKQLPTVTKVTLNKTSLTLNPGKSEKFSLKATVSPKNATNRKVTWKLSNKKKIVTIKNGKIVAKKKGTVTITAAADGKKATCKVTVKAAPDKKAKVTIKKKSVTLKVKKSYQIKAKISQKYGCNGFKYTVDKKGKKVVKVDKNGKVTAKKKGKAAITVKPYNGKGKSAKLKVTVKK